MRLVDAMALPPGENQLICANQSNLNQVAVVSFYNSHANIHLICNTSPANVYLTCATLPVNVYLIYDVLPVYHNDLKCASNLCFPANVYITCVILPVYTVSNVLFFANVDLIGYFIANVYIIFDILLLMCI